MVMHKVWTGVWGAAQAQGTHAAWVLLLPLLKLGALVNELKYGYINGTWYVNEVSDGMSMSFPMVCQ